MSFSIVIICRDEEKHIGRCIDAIIGLSDDIIVIDTGSTDNTISIIQTFAVRLIQSDWLGYGQTKNHGAQLAKYNWILSIDADEVIDDQLYQNIKDLKLNPQKMYGLKRMNHIGDRSLKYGHLKPEIKPRLFNRNQYQWDHRPVHELLHPKVQQIEVIPGQLLHYQAKNLEELSTKYEIYAKLSNPRNSIFKLLSPSFSFFRSYFLQLGFLEGRMGWDLARTLSVYNHKKYFG